MNIGIFLVSEASVLLKTVSTHLLRYNSNQFISGHPKENLWKRRSGADIGLEAIGFIVWQLAWSCSFCSNDDSSNAVESHQDGKKELQKPG